MERIHLKGLGLDGRENKVVKLSLYLIKPHWMNGGIAPRILNLSTRWKWVVSFTRRERAPGTHSMGEWVDPRAGLNMVAKRNSPAPAGNRTPVIPPVA
jgi:hypothetical protein